MSSFISMCLRSVHSLLSLRCGGRRSYVIYRPTSTSLRSVHFTHLSTPQHKWLSHSIPQNHAVIPFRSTVAYPPTLKTLQTLQDLQPSSHKSNQLNSIPFPNALCHSVPSPPMLFSNANPMVYFFPCDELAPLSAFQAERYVYYTLTVRF